MAYTATDHALMAKALRLARQGLYTTAPNPRVGCVIAQGAQVIAEGAHHQAGGPHAEIHALQQAGSQAQGATAYVTLEPCSHHGRTPPCADALIAAGITRVVVAMQDPNPQVSGQGITRLRQAGMTVQVGLREAEARALNPGFIQRMEQGRPWVRLKLAVSLDGRTALANGDSQWITGEAARHDVQYWRARACALLSGSGTVLADNPRLDMRLNAEQLGISPEQLRQPLRVILDSQLRTPPDARLFASPAPVSLCHSANADPGRAKALSAQAQLAVMPLCAGGIDLLAVMQHLARQQINEVHVEAGGVLAGALLREQLCDELLLYMAPHLLGSSARPLADFTLTRMDQRLSLQWQDLRLVGQDLRLIARPVYA